MTLLIDTPRWPWRGRLWAHMISDQSLDELHGAARDLGLRWVLFGRDHYDVPEELWPAACERATLVDSRVIVRSLRATGMRVGGGKASKAWKWRADIPAELQDARTLALLSAVRERLPEHDVDIVERPDAALVMHLFRTADFDEASFDGLEPPAGVKVIHTRGPDFYSVEVVLEKQSDAERLITPTRPDR